MNHLMFNYVRIKHFPQLKGYLCSMVTKILFIYNLSLSL